MNYPKYCWITHPEECCWEKKARCSCFLHLTKLKGITTTAYNCNQNFNFLYVHVPQPKICLPLLTDKRLYPNSCYGLPGLDLYAYAPLTLGKVEKKVHRMLRLLAWICWHNMAEHLCSLLFASSKESSFKLLLTFPVAFYTGAVCCPNLATTRIQMSRCLYRVHLRKTLPNFTCRVGDALIIQKQLFSN